MINIPSEFEKKNALITGGLGFIGSNLARRLVNLHTQVTLVDSLIPEYGGNFYNVHDIQDRVRINISDVRDPYGMRNLIKDQDFLFNLAGQTSHMDSMSDPVTDLEINAKAQLSILEACRRDNPGIRIVFASTRQIYGRPEYLPVDEKHPIRPVDVNGINKMAGEAYHILYYDVYGIPAVVLRLTNTIGPGMRIKDARQTFVGIWIRELMQGRSFEVWGGDQLRDFNYVDDVVDALLICAVDKAAEGRVFNLGGETPVSLRQLAELLIEVNGGGEFSVRTFPEDRKKIDIGDYYSNFDLINKTVGWTPKTPLRDGLKKTISFYQKNGSHYL